MIIFEGRFFGELCGSLALCTRALPTGRAFSRYLYLATTKTKEPHHLIRVILIINIYGWGWGSRSHFLNRFPSGMGLSPGDDKCWMHNFTSASPPIPNIKFLSFVISEKCVILKICIFSIENHDFTKNYVDRPKTKSAIVLTKIILKIYTFSIKKD